MTRHVYAIETTDEGLVGIFGSTSRMARYAREQYQVVFPKGSLGELSSGQKVAVILTQKWDEAAEMQLTISRVPVR